MGKLSTGKYVEIFAAIWVLLIVYGMIAGFTLFTLANFFTWLIWALISQAVISLIITGVVWAVVEKTK